MLTGIDRPTWGEIVIAGAPILAYRDGQLAAWRGRHLGIAFQFFQLIPMLTVVENIMLPMELNNLYTNGGRRERAPMVKNDPCPGPIASPHNCPYNLS